MFHRAMHERVRVFEKVDLVTDDESKPTAQHGPELLDQVFVGRVYQVAGELLSFQTLRILVIALRVGVFFLSLLLG